MPATLPPTWVHWDGDTYGNHFRGKEVQAFQLPAKAGANTTYRNDFPEPPLYWAHAEKPDRSNRPTPAFGHTSSHRADFPQYEPGAGMPTRAPYPEQKFHPKLMSVTTARADFKIPVLAPAKPPTKAIAHKANDAPMGTTTMRADYLEWKLPGTQGMLRQDGPSKPTKFYGMTTTRNDFHWPKELPPPYQAPKNTEHSVPAFEGTTTYRTSYEPQPLPLGMQADIGIQTASGSYSRGGQGGQFTLMIPMGKPAPCVASKMFTTVVDAQQTASIVVVAKRPEFPHGVILGTFDMSGMKPDKVGSAKIDVTLKLTNERTLLATAFYRNAKKEKALFFQAKKPLRTVAQASDVPEDD